MVSVIEYPSPVAFEEEFASIIPGRRECESQKRIRRQGR